MRRVRQACTELVEVLTVTDIHVGLLMNRLVSYLRDRKNKRPSPFLERVFCKSTKTLLVIYLLNTISPEATDFWPLILTT